MNKGEDFVLKSILNEVKSPKFYSFITFIADEATDYTTNIFHSAAFVIVNVNVGNYSNCKLGGIYMDSIENTLGPPHPFFLRHFPVTKKIV